MIAVSAANRAENPPTPPKPQLDGLSGDSVYRFYEDREGNLWVATTKGIDCFRDVRVATFSTREGLATPEVDSVLAAQDGTVWIGGADALDAIDPDWCLQFKRGKACQGIKLRRCSKITRAGCGSGLITQCRFTRTEGSVGSTGRMADRSEWLSG